MAVDFVELTLVTTVVLITISLAAFVLTSGRAYKIGRSEGLKDFRVQMVIVGWIWLAGEVVELLIRMEPGPTLHIASMIIFSAFIVWRAKSFLL